MSSECSLFTVLQSDPHSPLFSTLFLLPKDQTLKRVTKHPRSRLVLLNTSHPDEQILSPHDLVSSQGSHKRLRLLSNQTTLQCRNSRAGFASGRRTAPHAHQRPGSWGMEGGTRTSLLRGSVM